MAAAIGQATHTHEEYLSLMLAHPDTLGPRGSIKDGELEIVSDERVIKEQEPKVGESVGIVYKNKFYTVLNDLFRTQSGEAVVYGTYKRIVPSSMLDGSGNIIAGSVILPQFADESFALISCFRHATREHCLEAIRGNREMGESPEKTATGEALSEAGLKISDVTQIGVVTPDSGLTAARVAVFTAKISSKGDAAPEKGEAIRGIVKMSMQEIAKAFKACGEPISCKVGTDQGLKEQQVVCTDGFLASAMGLLLMQKIA